MIDTRPEVWLSGGKTDNGNTSNTRENMKILARIAAVLSSAFCLLAGLWILRHGGRLQRGYAGSGDRVLFRGQGVLRRPDALVGGGKMLRASGRSMTARLIIFDIDGTLTETAKLDEECFVRTLADVYGFDKIDTDWSRYRHSTDAGVFHEIYEGRTGRAPSMDDFSRFRRHFVGLIGVAACQSPFDACRAVRSIGWHWQPVRGAIRRGSKWAMRTCCHTMIFRRRRATTRRTGK